MARYLGEARGKRAELGGKEDNMKSSIVLATVVAGTFWGVATIALMGYLAWHAPEPVNFFAPLAGLANGVLIITAIAVIIWSISFAVDKWVL